jgi:hypothetical protein
MPLAISDANRLYALEALERPREADRAVLPAGKENKCG